MDLLLKFQGRIPRSKFWIGVLILLVAQWVLMFVLATVLGVSLFPQLDPNDPQSAENMMQGMSVIGIPIIIVVLIFLWPALAIYTKRWHDRNKSGWWSLILFVPLIGAIWFFVELGCLRGTEGPNNFGADPLM